MKVTLSWLKEFVDIDLSIEQIAETLTMRGLEIEEITRPQYAFSGVVTARVLAVDPHPSADHLRVCRVSDGTAERNVVCGAPNVRKGKVYPLALPGAKLGEMSIETRPLRGVVSEGMLCSESELGLSERADGLLELPDDAPLGKDLKELLGEADTTFDVFVTPNRADCMSVIGIARELASAMGRPLKKRALSLQPAPAGEAMNVEILDPQRCPRYTGRLIAEVKIGPSPLWLARRLHAVGVRSINNVVDITNYVMMETGQPLHAFDRALLRGNRIVVRTADKGERFVTLDGKEHELGPEDLLICDAERPVALAGIMGGLNSEVSEQTTAVFLESAHFEPTGIRKTSGRLQVASESSRRFERGVDPNGAVYALDRAAQLMVELAGGKILGEVVDVYAKPIAPLTIRLSTAKCNALLGTNLPQEKIGSILQSLELPTQPMDADLLSVQIPTFRFDLTRPVDLMEEVARCIGYHAVPPEPAPRINQMQEPNQRDRFRDQVRRMLVSAGLRETVAYNLVPRKIAEAFLPNGLECVNLINPLSADMAVFRPNILISLLGTAAYNRNRQMPDLRIYEIGQSGWKINGKIEEKLQIGVLLCGERLNKEWYQGPVAFDFYDIKGIYEHLFEGIGISKARFVEAKEPIWDRESVGLEINGRYLGSFGKIRKEICAFYKFKVCDVFGLWLDFDSLFELRTINKRYDPVPRFPSSPFDLALIVDIDTPVGRLEEEIRQAGGPYLREVRLFDLYQGDQVPPGKKSAAFSLTFSSKERTLNEDEVNETVEKILERLRKELGAELRPS
ncbi:MAG: phenylalanine--tRNA ligase subunit beta [candidate division KSB1 bacterium]|nr:phenylalanine--tRNA ligase subunit beta [candidate division KSB1 bacterium]